MNGPMLDDAVLEDLEAIGAVTTPADLLRHMLSGLTAVELATLFRVKRPAMVEAVSTLKPVGKRGRTPTYAVADVAPRIVEPALDIETYIKGLKPKDLPPALQKAFWDAQEARQSFEEKAGNLWHTHRVQAVIGQFVMLVRQRLVLATDQVDRMAPLTEEQRRVVQHLLDQLLTELQRSVIEAFKDYKGSGDRQDLYENSPARQIVGDGLDL